MNEVKAAQSLTEWISVTPDRVVVLVLLLGAIWVLWRRDERRAKEMRELYQRNEERGTEVAVTLERNTTLFEKIMKKLD